MPKLVHKDAWVTGFRKALRTSTAKGWNVREHRGKVRIQVVRDQAPMASVAIPFTWSVENSGDILTRVRNIYALTTKGHTLKIAAQIAAGKAPKLTRERNWDEAFEKYKVQKIEFGTGVDPEMTWRKEFVPVITDAIALLQSKEAPTTSADLLDAVIRNWKIGSRTRAIRARRLSTFLTYCVDRCGFPQEWRPPANLMNHIGRKAKKDHRDISGKMDSMSDQEILNLIASLPTDKGLERYRRCAVKWQNALKLCALYGLRPIELRYLQIRKDKKSKKEYLYCTYEKRSGAGVTEPRDLEPLPLINDQGELIEWNLFQLFKAQLLELPPLNSKYGVGEAMRKYMERSNEGWNSLKRIMKDRGENLGSYSFRHSYSLRGHQKGIDAGSMAKAMGHSLRTHLDSYETESDAGRESAFDKARSRDREVRQ
tara:strand:- start:269 stop:1546 length:1278 start_codon:yes stop_codon:yes gene_type:complete